MKLFLWNSIEHLTTNFHSGGGLVIVAESIEAARTYWKASGAAKEEHLFDESSYVIQELPDPDKSWDVTDGQPEQFIFPDAGCC